MQLSPRVGLDHPPELLGDPMCVTVSRTRKQQGELLSPPAGNDVGFPHALQEDLAQLLQCQVPQLMSEAIVDRLEAINVEHDYAEAVVGRPAALDDLLELLREIATASEARQVTCCPNGCHLPPLFRTLSVGLYECTCSHPHQVVFVIEYDLQLHHVSLHAQPRTLLLDPVAYVEQLLENPKRANVIACLFKRILQPLKCAYFQLLGPRLPIQLKGTLEMHDCLLEPELPEQDICIRLARLAFVRPCFPRALRWQRAQELLLSLVLLPQQTERATNLVLGRLFEHAEAACPELTQRQPETGKRLLRLADALIHPPFI